MVDDSHRITWSPEALADLDGIWDYYQHAAGVQTAENRVRRIYHGCAVLSEHALAGRARDEVRKEVRSLTVEPFVVFYRIVSDTVQIIRVLDERQDIDAAL